jgi:hypothetical protein
VSLALAAIFYGVVSLEGKVVVAENNTIIMTDNETGASHTFQVLASAIITRDGRRAVLEDLVAGDDVRVTVDASQNATSIDAQSPRKATTNRRTGREVELIATSADLERVQNASRSP